jgi:hypothetical protein
MGSPLLAESTQYPYGFHRIRSTPLSPQTVVYFQSPREIERAHRHRSSMLRSKARVCPEEYPDRTCFYCVTGYDTSVRTVLSYPGRFGSKPRTILLSNTRFSPPHMWISRVPLHPAYVRSQPTYNPCGRGSDWNPVRGRCDGGGPLYFRPLRTPWH